MRFVSLVLLAMLALIRPALAQSWEEHEYPDAGFSVQLPGEPVVEKGTYAASGGVSAPATIYSLKQPAIIFSMTVVDLTGTPADNRNAIDDTVKRLHMTGEVPVDISAEINGQYGRELSITNTDGSRSIYAVFFFNHRLYQLEGKALAPNPARQSGNATRFQQSLRFTGARRFGLF